MKYLPFIILCFFGVNSISQSITLTGKVKDSINQPIEIANVIAYNSIDSTIHSFGMTDYEGRYKLILEPNKSYRIQCKYIGYQTFEKTISNITSDQELDIQLLASDELLNVVEVTHELPVSISGDTITYKTDHFTNGTERKLGDVIESLPGFEIDEDGQIKVQGKTVDKVLVEGKEFFDGDSKMATQNIPADAVDKIQLLRNYTDVAPMSGLGNDESLAINVKLDDDKKNMWFGDIEIAGGLENRYLFHPNLFYYSPKLNVNLIGDANNTGKQAFTLRDYFRFSGGLRNIGRNGGSTINMNSDEFGISLMQNNMAKHIDAQLGALNLNYQPNKKWRFSAFGIGSRVNTTMENNSTRTYIRTNGNTTETTSSVLNQDNGSILLKGDATFKPNGNTQIAYGAFLKASNISETDDRTSSFGTTANPIIEGTTQTPLTIDQNLSGFFAVNDKNIMSIESSLGYSEKDRIYQLETGFKPLQGLLPIDSADSYNLNQLSDVVSSEFKAEFNEYHIINKTNHISFNLGVNSTAQNYKSKMTGMNSEEWNPDNLYSNTVNYNFQDYYAGLHYKTKLGKLTLAPGIAIHNYRLNNTQSEVFTSLSKELITPSLFTKYEFSKSKSLMLNYNLENQFTDVQNLANKGVIRNYNSWFTGASSLENSLFHNASLNFFNFNMYNHINIHGMVNYQRRYNAFNEGISYSGLDRLVDVTNTPVWNNSLNGSGSIEKSFVKFKLKLEGFGSYADFNNVVEGETNKNTSLTREYEISSTSKFKKGPNFEIGFKQNWNTYSTNLSDQTYVTNAPFVNLEIPFLKHFTLATEYDFNNYQSLDGSTKSNYDFLNATLFFEKKDSPFQFNLSGTNLLNTTAIRRDGFNNNMISTYSYIVQPRIVTFSVKYVL